MQNRSKILCASSDGEPGLCPKAALDCLFLSSPFTVLRMLIPTCLTSLLWSRKIFPLVPSSHVQSYTITIIDLIWNCMSSFYQKLSHVCGYAISNNFVKQAKQRLSQACLCVFEGLLWRHRSEVACCRDWGSGSSSPGRHSEWHESSTVTQLVPGHMTESVELM